MDDIARLLAMEDIRQLKARYYRCMDTKDWEGLSKVFAQSWAPEPASESCTLTRTRRSERRTLPVSA